MLVVLPTSWMFLFSSLMRDAEKLMSRCIYLNILKATISVAKENETASETLEKYGCLLLFSTHSGGFI